MAKWYKETIQNGLLDALYTNKNKVAGVNLNDPAVKEQIYERYLKAYKKGAFNYIKEDPTPDGQVVPRKYFSGGISRLEPAKVDRSGRQADVHADGNNAMITIALVAAGAAAIAGGLYGVGKYIERDTKLREDREREAYYEHALQYDIAPAIYGRHEGEVVGNYIWKEGVNHHHESIQGGPGYEWDTGDWIRKDHAMSPQTPKPIEDAAMFSIAKAKIALGVRLKNVDMILSLLSDDDLRVYIAAVTALDELGASKEQKGRGLIAALSTKNVTVYRHVLEGLQNLGASREEMLNVCIPALISKDVNVRYYAISKLGALGDKRAIRPLRALLLTNYSHWVERSWIYKALKLLGDEEVIKRFDEYDSFGHAEVLKRLRDRQPKDASRSLVKVGDQPSFNGIQGYDIKTNSNLTYEDQAAQYWLEGNDFRVIFKPELSHEAEFAPNLGYEGLPNIQTIIEPHEDLHIKRGDHLPPIQAMSTPEAPKKDAAMFGLWWTLLGGNNWYEQMSKLKPYLAKQKFEVLVVLLKEKRRSVYPDIVQVASAEALGNLGDKRAIEPLRVALKGEGKYGYGLGHLPAAAREALIKIVNILGDSGKTEDIVLLRELLKERDETIATSAAFALAKLGDQEAITALKAKLLDRDSGVRQKAWDMLVNLGADRQEMERIRQQYEKEAAEAAERTEEPYYSSGSADDKFDETAGHYPGGTGWDVAMLSLPAFLALPISKIQLTEWYQSLSIGGRIALWTVGAMEIGLTGIAVYEKRHGMYAKSRLLELLQFSEKMNDYEGYTTISDELHRRGYPEGNFRYVDNGHHEGGEWVSKWERVKRSDAAMVLIDEGKISIWKFRKKVGKIVAMLGNEHPEVRRKAMESLEALEDTPQKQYEFAQRYRGWLTFSSPSWWSKDSVIWAVRKIAKVNRSEAIKLIEDHLNVQDYVWKEVSKEVLEETLETSDEQYHAGLIAIKAYDDDIRNLGIVFLKKSGKKEAIPILESLLWVKELHREAKSALIELGADIREINTISQDALVRWKLYDELESIKPNVSDQLNYDIVELFQKALLIVRKGHSYKLRLVHVKHVPEEEPRVIWYGSGEGPGMDSGTPAYDIYNVEISENDAAMFGSKRNQSPEAFEFKSPQTRREWVQWIIAVLVGGGFFTYFALPNSDKNKTNSAPKNSSPKEDKAVLAENGGIDLDQINVLRNGKKVLVHFDQAQLSALEQGGFEGFTPVITGFQYISSPFPLLGINVPKQEVQLAKA